MGEDSAVAIAASHGSLIGEQVLGVAKDIHKWIFLHSLGDVVVQYMLLDLLNMRIYGH